MGEIVSLKRRYKTANHTIHTHLGFIAVTVLLSS
jgi:hypothetical protein